MNTVKTNPILSADIVRRKIRRMAIEIAERNSGLASLFVAGVAGNGVVVAQNVIKELSQLVDYPVHFVKININKKQPLEVSLDTTENFDSKTIVVVDDVADSGRTLLYALKPFLSYTPKSIQTLVLVERSHKLFPVQSDYVGLTVATTLQEHITVETAEDKITGAWLH